MRPLLVVTILLCAMWSMGEYASAEVEYAPFVVAESSRAVGTATEFGGKDDDSTNQATRNYSVYTAKVQDPAPRRGGTVVFDPPGGTYEPGTQVKVEAIPDAGYMLEYWGFGVEVSETCREKGEFTAAEGRAIAPTFCPAHALTVEVVPSAVDIQNPDRKYLTVSPRPASMPLDITPGRIEGREKTGSKVLLEAEPYAGGGYAFHHWESDNVPLAYTNALSLTMDADKSVRAVYVIPEATVVGETFGEGTLTFSDAPGDSFQGKAVRPYATTGGSVTVNAVAAKYWTLDHWELPGDWTYDSGDAQKNGRTGISINLTADLHIAAVFVPETDAVSYPTDINNDGSVDSADVDIVVSAMGGASVDWDADVDGDCMVNLADKRLVTDAALGHVGSSENILMTYMQGQGAVTYELPEPAAERPRLFYKEAFDEHNYAPRQQVILMAHPAPGWRFEHWLGVSKSESCRVPVIMDRFSEICAVFVHDKRSMWYKYLENPDADHVPSYQEAELGSDASLADSDSDGLPDWWEVAFDLNPANNAGPNGAIGDPDSDYLPSYQEAALGTNPNSADSDRDGLPDWWELAFDLDPIGTAGDDGASGDPDGDCADNIAEFNAGTSPADRPMQLKLYLSATGAGRVVSSLERKSYDYLQKISITASPIEGWVFSHWEGDSVSSQAEIAVTFDTHKYLRAVFVEENGAATGMRRGPIGLLEESPRDQGHASLAASEDIRDTDAQQLRERYAAYMQMIQARPMHYMTAMRDAMRLEAQIRALLVKSFTSGRSAEEVREDLADSVEWREFPTVMRVGGPPSAVPPEPNGMELYGLDAISEESRPIVLFRTAETHAHGTLIVLQNALLVREQDQFYRVRFVPYAILAERNGSGGALYPDFSEPGQEPGIATNNWTVIDTYETSNDVPVIGIVRGPSGNGDYLSIQVAQYSHEKHEWKIAGVVDWDGILRWSYDSDRDEFTFGTLGNMATGEIVTRTQDARDLFRRNAAIDIRG